jgi:threonine synthase
MADTALSRRFRLSSANSINIGRLLPQSIYYANASLEHYRQSGRKPAFIVPTGNLGNALACIMARAAGLPIGSIILATNANRTIGDYLAGSDWLPRASVRTLASAMDVGNPSNMERLRHLFGEADTLAQIVAAESVSDDQIEDEIRAFWRDYHLAICPHTATAAHAYRALSPSAKRDQDWILVSTAHPAKFESIVEPLIGEAVPLPDSLAQLQARASHFTRIEPQLDALVERLDGLHGTGAK